MNARLCALFGQVLALAMACDSEPLPAASTLVPDAAPTSGTSGQTPSGGDSNGDGGGGESSTGAGQGGSGDGALPARGGAAEGGVGGHLDAAAGGTKDAPVIDPFEGPTRCSSGKTRDPNESEAPEMNPGFPCNFCHAASNAASGEGDAPIFAFAGTLYRHAHEPNSCVGEGDGEARVLVKDAAGQELSALANSSGNFFVEDATLAPPFSVKVLFEGRERAAATPHQHADCNLCHTETGSQGAPGRVVLP